MVYHGWQSWPTDVRTMEGGMGETTNDMKETSSFSRER